MKIEEIQEQEISELESSIDENYFIFEFEEQKDNIVNLKNYKLYYLKWYKNNSSKLYKYL